MKKNLVITLLLATCFLHAAESQKICPSDPYYIMVDNVPTDVKSIVSYDEMRKECLGKQSIEAFEKIKAKLTTRGLDIFKIRIYGFSFLEFAIKTHSEAPGFNLFDSTQERSNAFFDHLLSQVTKENLNEFVDTAYNHWSRPFWFGTAVAVAAYASPSCFKKIITHKDFDATTFLHSRPYPHDENKFSLNPQTSRELLMTEAELDYLDDRIRIKELLIALEEFEASQVAR